MQAEDVLETHSQELLNEEQCWSIVLARDAQADGSFVYAVRSTGIYCRPSCPARRPKREQVTFFREPETAEAAGFRPCLRCHPQQVSPPDPQAELIEQVCRYIELHLDTPLPLARLGQEVHLSPSHLQRTFKRIKGVTPHQYAELCRLRAFKARLHEGASVTSALYDAGYTSSSSVYERAVRQLGMTPKVYRQGGKGVRIGYTMVNTDLLQYPLTDRRNEESLISPPWSPDMSDSNKTIPNMSSNHRNGPDDFALVAVPSSESRKDIGSHGTPQGKVYIPNPNESSGNALGYVLIAATERGVVTVRFGDSETELVADLLREYPEATLERDEEALQPWVTLLMDYLQGHKTRFEVPLDVHASAFQWKVWEALRAIPVGQTRSYQDIAQAIGQPTAARAVARACATNAVAVFIPCHRVIRENGQLGGYRWGVERKRRLLALEQQDEHSKHEHTQS